MSQTAILQQFHEGHPGMSLMEALAHTYVRTLAQTLKKLSTLLNC